MGKILEKIWETIKKIAEFNEKYLSISESSGSESSSSYDLPITHSFGERIPDFEECRNYNMRNLDHADLMRMKGEYNATVLGGHPGDIRDRIAIKVLEKELETV
jgi:hypothetical protein